MVLLTSSYQTIRLAGELLSLPKEIKIELDETYELINAYNRMLSTCESVPIDGSFWNRIKTIEMKLQHLGAILPEILKYLRKEK